MERCRNEPVLLFGFRAFIHSGLRHGVSETVRTLYCIDRLLIA
jgi:hypothetical protein